MEFIKKVNVLVAMGNCFYGMKTVHVDKSDTVFYTVLIMWRIFYADLATILGGKNYLHSIVT